MESHRVSVAQQAWHQLWGEDEAPLLWDLQDWKAVPQEISDWLVQDAATLYGAVLLWTRSVDSAARRRDTSRILAAAGPTHQATLRWLLASWVSDGSSSDDPTRLEPWEAHWRSLHEELNSLWSRGLRRLALSRIMHEIDKENTIHKRNTTSLSRCCLHWTAARLAAEDDHGARLVAWMATSAQPEALNTLRRLQTFTALAPVIRAALAQREKPAIPAAPDNYTAKPISRPPSSPWG